LRTIVFADSLESAKVCDPLAKKRIIKLGNKDRSALRLTDGRMFKSWSGSSGFNCQFELQAISKDELAVVVQNLSLRRDPITNECIDFVQVWGLKREAQDQVKGVKVPFSKMTLISVPVLTVNHAL